MITVWMLVVLHATGVHSNRAVYGWNSLGTFGTQKECLEAVINLSNKSINLPNELGVQSIITFECIKEVID